MAILTGNEIKNQIENRHIEITPYDDERVQPNSYDISLGDKVSYYTLTDYHIQVGQHNEATCFEKYGMLALNSIEDKDCGFIRTIPVLDSKQENTMLEDTIGDSGFVFLPNILYLVESAEEFWSDKFVSEVSGTSSLARLGITVHKTAGYSNLGHRFKWVLEVEVTHAVKVYKGMKIGQVYFHTTHGDTSMQYNGLYKDKQLLDNTEICGSLLESNE